MKDAKGHGSDAHSSGVNAIGQSRPIAKIKPTQNPMNNAPVGSQRITFDTGSTYDLETLRKGGTRLTPEANKAIIESYREKIRSGTPIPPILITEEGHIVDGNHRHAAYKAEKVKTAPVEIMKGARIG